MAFLTNRAPLAAVMAAGLVLTMAGCNREQATPGGEAGGASVGAGEAGLHHPAGRRVVQPLGER